MIRVYANIPGYLHGFLDDLLGSEIRLVDQGSGSSCGIIEREREYINCDQYDILLYSYIGMMFLPKA